MCIRDRAWLALPQVFGSKSASIVLAAEVPAQAVFSEFISGERQRSTIEIYLDRAPLALPTDELAEDRLRRHLGGEDDAGALGSEDLGEGQPCPVSYTHLTLPTILRV